MLPLDLILDGKFSPSAKVVYAVLKTFPKDKVPAVSLASPGVTVTHREIIGRSNLSRHTVVKALTRLVLAGWIIKERSVGSTNRYVFTTPVTEV